MKETSKMIELTKLFEASDDSLFKKQSSQKNDVCFSKSILSKYPSHFFDTWIKKIGVTKRFTVSLIENIINAETPLLKQELIHLLYSLIEKKYYTKNNVIHLENLLLSHAMYHHILYLRMHIKERLQPITSDNLNFLVGLTKVGISSEHINDQILKLSLDQYDSLIDAYDLIVNKMLTLNKDEQLDLVSRVNPTVFQLLLDSNIVNIDDKILQKILSYSAKTQNIDLYTHLLQNYNTTPSKLDILGIFGLEPTGKAPIKTKMTRGRRGIRNRYRYISPSTRFRHKFNFKKSIYELTYMTKLIKLVKYYTDKNIDLSTISGIKHFICHLLSLDHIELQLEICKNIKYKHGGHTLSSLIRRLIKTDNDVLLKKFIEYSQISTEKFVNGSHLTYAIRNSQFKISQFMIDVLKMKTTGSSVVRGCINCEKLKFLHKNNLPVQENVMNLLFNNGDISSIDYCIKTFDFKVTVSMLLQSFKSQHKNSFTVFKKYYNVTENKYPLKILSYLLSNTITIHTLSAIRLILKNTTVKSTIMPKVLKTKNLSIIKYFCDVHKLTFDKVSCKDLQELIFCENVMMYGGWRRRYRRGRYNYSSNNNHQKKILKILQYVKQQHPLKFVEFNEMLDNRDTMLSNFVTCNIDYSILDVLNETQTLFEWQIPEEIVCKIIKNSYSSDITKKLLNYYPNFAPNLINELMSQMNIYEDIHSFLEIASKFNIDLSKHITSSQLMKNIVDRDVSIDNAKAIANLCPQIKITPSIYSYFVKSLYHGMSARSKKYYLRHLVELNDYYNEITLEDYNNLLQYLKTLPCKFNIVEYEMNENEKHINGMMINNNYDDNEDYVDYDIAEIENDDIVLEK